jgi:hypothetical protein
MAHNNRGKRKASKVIVPAAPVERLIYLVRGERVIVDADLALLYGVTTKRLNQQIRRNADRFPPDFMFQLTSEEAQALRSQDATLEDPTNLRSHFATSRSQDQAQVLGNKGVNESVLRSQIVTSSAGDRAQVIEDQEVSAANLRSQIATSSAHGGRRYRPFAFTEHGAIMAATVLNSPQAVKVSVFVVRAFVKLRGMVAAHRELAVRIDELERKVEFKLQEHDGQILNLFEVIRDLIEGDEKPKAPIGFQTELGEAGAGQKRLRRAQAVKG